tara:strand:+ start:422 stop:1012 length:591 start_codon:yes stop_codon:yes gene_type:complete
MFTGIIEKLVKINQLKQFDNHWNISVDLNFDDIDIGSSIAINGVCLTVVDIDNRSFYFDIINETLQKTTLKYLKKNDLVNVERCMKINARLDGHIVQGHIECIGELISKKLANDETKIKIKLDQKYTKYCIYKGSIAIDGISLTISGVGLDFIECCIIPHTLQNTTLGFRKEGDLFNIETDIISKYIEKQLIYKNI